LKAKPDVVKGQRAVKTGSLRNVQAPSQAKSENGDKKTVLEVWFHYTFLLSECCMFWW